MSERDLFAKLDEYTIEQIARKLREYSEDNEERIDTYPYLRDLVMLARTCRRMHAIVGALLSREIDAMDGSRGISGEDYVYYTDKWGRLHRYNGPAMQYTNGQRQWCIDGRPHRIGGPAVIYADGSREWYLYGRSHREDGPAVIRVNGERGWYRDGQHYRTEYNVIIFAINKLRELFAKYVYRAQ